MGIMEKLSRMLSADRELALFRFLQDTAARLDGAREERQVLRYFLRAAGEFFGAPIGCVAVATRGAGRVELRYAVPREAAWNAPLLEAFLRGDHPAIPFDTLLAPIRRRGRPWGVLGLRRDSGEFARGEGKGLARVTATLGGLLDRLDHQRMLDVRARIDRKIMEQLRPRDLFYQILDGLRSLTHYDHSSALLMAVDEGEAVELAAEQIACLKCKSTGIGRRFPLDRELAAALCDGVVRTFNREGDQWRACDDAAPPGLAPLLDYNRVAGGDASTRGARHDGPAPRVLPREGSMLCAPIVTSGGLIGLVKVAAMQPATLGAFEAEILKHFTAHASVAIQYLQRTESLEGRILAAEKKHAAADIARGVSHDVNNALGAMLPLIQQMRADAGEGTLDAAQLQADLERLEQSLQVSRRIFNGMLSLARSGSRALGEANLRRALDGTLAILRPSIERRGIHLEVDVTDDLPAVRGGQNDLTQLFLNLFSNARDAMPNGGRLLARARRRDDGVDVEICDTGCGIRAEDLPRVEEPFFSTKADGNGLGLSICRSIVTDLGGDLRLTSEPGRGTNVRLRLPLG